MRASITEPGLAAPMARPAIATMFRRLPFALALTVLAGCASETLFQSNFDSTAIGQPPAPVQATGTANVFGPPGCGWTAGSNWSVARPLPAGMNIAQIKLYWPGPRTAESTPCIPAMGA